MAFLAIRTILKIFQLLLQCCLTCVTVFHFINKALIVSHSPFDKGPCGASLLGKLFLEPCFVCISKFELGVFQSNRFGLNQIINALAILQSVEARISSGVTLI